ncbi:MAG: hypothetical protein R3279_05395 [Putridiphycobacter sp.]|nr:hypothetical protein [Putridiphycobacter sp.]
MYYFLSENILSILSYIGIAGAWFFDRKLNQKQKREEINELATQNQKLVEEVKSITAQNDGASIANIDSKLNLLDKMIDTVSTNYEGQITKMKTHHELELSSLKRSHEAEIIALTARFKSDIASLKEEVEKWRAIAKSNREN